MKEFPPSTDRNLMYLGIRRAIFGYRSCYIWNTAGCGFVTSESATFFSMLKKNIASKVILQGCELRICVHNINDRKKLLLQELCRETAHFSPAYTAKLQRTVGTVPCEF